MMRSAIRIVAIAFALGASVACVDLDVTQCPSGRVCGDGEQCAADQDVCISDGCGDGVLDGNEVCDDGNVIDGDGCSADCLSNERCGNAIVDAGEFCDCGEGEVAPREWACMGRQNNALGGLCTQACALHCGDGSLAAEEMCDGMFNTQTCLDYGFDRGPLGCGDACFPDVAECRDIGWERQRFDIGNLFAVWGSGPNAVFAVRENYGAGSPIIRYDGQQWNHEDVPEEFQYTTFLDVSGDASGDVFAVGLDGAILRYNGAGVWTESETLSWPHLFGVTVTGTSAYAVGGDYFQGSVLRYEHADGEWVEVTGWGFQGADTGPHLDGVWSDSNRLIAVGDQIITEYDGEDWIAARFDNIFFTDVWGTGNDVFAVGSEGYIVHRNGPGDWSFMTSGTDELLIGVWGSGPGDVMAVGANGTVLHYDGNDRDVWTPLTGVEVRLEGLWSSGPDQVIAAGWNGTILTFSGQSWTQSAQHNDRNLAGVWAARPDDVYALFSSGDTLLHFDGDLFSTTDLGINQRLRHISGRSSDVFYVVGGNGGRDDDSTVIRITSDGSCPLASGGCKLRFADGVPNDRPIEGVWVTEAGDAYAVGRATPEEAALIVHCPRADSQCYALPAGAATDNSFYAVSGCDRANGAVDLVAVGSLGRISHCKGRGSCTQDNDWTGAPIGQRITDENLYGVWGASCDEYFAVGNAGAIAHYNGTEWTLMDSGTTEPLRDVWGIAPDNVYAVGFNGTMLHYDGAQWSPVNSNTFHHMTGISGAPNAAGTAWSIVSVGESGKFLRLLRTDT